MGSWTYLTLVYLKFRGFQTQTVENNYALMYLDYSVDA